MARCIGANIYINESQFANWDPSSRTGTVRILGLTYINSFADFVTYIYVSPKMRTVPVRELGSQFAN